MALAKRGNFDRATSLLEGFGEVMRPEVLCYVGEDGNTPLIAATLKMEQEKPSNPTMSGGSDI